jgi:hypothetical protein
MTRWVIHLCCDIGKRASRFLAPLGAAFTKSKWVIILRGFRENQTPFQASRSPRREGDESGYVNGVLLFVDGGQLA